MKIPPAIPFDQQECNLGRAVWSVPRLVQLAADLPIITVPLDALNLNCTEYICNMREMVAHAKQIASANRNHPILLDEDGEIMDGRHRIMRALFDEDTTITAKRFDTNPTPCRYKD